MHVDTVAHTPKVHRKRIVVNSAWPRLTSTLKAAGRTPSWKTGGGVGTFPRAYQQACAVGKQKLWLRRIGGTRQDVLIPEVLHTG